MFDLAQWQRHFAGEAVSGTAPASVGAVPPQPVGVVVAPIIERSPAMTPMALRAAAEPHEHSWFQACRQDRFGLTVLDCACGARKRLRQGPFGAEEVQVPPPDNVLGDVLFDASMIAAPARAA